MNNIPSQGSGSVRDARSSMENLTSTPLSSRVSGSALSSQYDLSTCASTSAAEAVVGDDAVAPFSSSSLTALLPFAVFGFDWEAAPSVLDYQLASVSQLCNFAG